MAASSPEGGVVLAESAGIQRRLNLAWDGLYSFVLASASSFALAINVIVESFHSARLGVALLGVLGLHLLRHPRVIYSSESTIYTAFIAYMLIALLWTDDVRLAMNTLVPAFAFLIVLVLYSSLAAYHDIRFVVTGATSGFLLGAAVYSSLTRFPMAYPPDFSYNAIAGMYFAGLFSVLLSALFVPWRRVLFLLGLLFLSLIVATTSIKFNLGVLFGAAVASFFHVGPMLRIVRRNLMSLFLFACIVLYLVVSNEPLVAAIDRGMDRIALGVEVLRAREDVPGYSAFESRSRWQSDGISGWMRNPLFGDGVEAFRARHGVTSHSTPVDLLYNVGLIGFVLFYFLFRSILARAFCSGAARANNALRSFTLAVATCYAFVSLSAPLHYNAFFAAFIGLSFAAHRHVITERVGKVR